MATTAKQVFELAMSLMDELDENGKATSSDTKEYENRTLFILNVLRGELYPYSDTYELGESGKRPIVALIDSFDKEIGLDDYICQSVMPYGLAAHLLLDENPTAANFFNGRYQELTMLLARGLPQASTDVTDVYGGIEYGEFSRW